MESKMEVLRNMMDLLGTMDEAMDFIDRGLDGDKPDGLGYIVADVIDGLISVENSLEQNFQDEQENDEDHSIEKLNNAVEEFVKYFDAGDTISAKEYMKNSLKPAFAQWKSYLENRYRDIVLS